MKTLQSMQHPLVKRLTQLRKDRKARVQSATVVIEGKKLVRENRALIRALLTTDKTVESPLPDGAQAYHVTPEIIQKISGVKSPEGIIAEVEVSKILLPLSLKRLLVLENINDPGNLGTLIRTALAFGWDGVFLLGDCCDPYNDKAIRASKGAVFRIPFESGNVETFKNLIDIHSLSVWIADLEGKGLGNTSTRERVALVLGSEAQGPSDQVLELGEKVTIPIHPEMESLNVAVAGGIFLYYLRNQ